MDALQGFRDGPAGLALLAPVGFLAQGPADDAHDLLHDLEKLLVFVGIDDEVRTVGRDGQEIGADLGLAPGLHAEEVLFDGRAVAPAGFGREHLAGNLPLVFGFLPGLFIKDDAGGETLVPGEELEARGGRERGELADAEPIMIGDSISISLFVAPGHDLIFPL